MEQNIFFPKTLDTVLQNPKLIDNLNNLQEMQRVEYILKEGGLFSENILLSATQFIDNRGIRDILFRGKGFKNFLVEKVKVGMWSDLSSFSNLVNQQIKDNMIFSSFPSEAQNAIKNGKINNIIDLDKKFPQLHFKYFIEKLDEIYDTKKNIFKLKFQSYPDLVENNLEQNIDKIDNIEVKSLCSELMERTETEFKLHEDDEITRSIFYLAVDKSPYNPISKNIVKHFLLDYEYNRNLYETNNLNCLTHITDEDTKLFNAAFSNIPKEFKSAEYKIVDSFESEGKINLDLIDFDFIANLYSEYKNRFETYLPQIRNAKDTESIKESHQSYFDFLIPHIQNQVREKQKESNKKVKIGITIIVGLGTSSLTLGMPYLNTGIGTLAAGIGGGLIGYSIEGLLENQLFLPRQTAQLNEVKTCLENIRLLKDK